MTKIQWTEATWNPVVGCSPVSEGCRNCYAAKEAIRLAGNPNPKVSTPYAGTAEMRGLGRRRRAVFTGKVTMLPDRLNQPLRWRKPRRVFVNSMSDLFHEAVPFEFIAEVFKVMRLASQHTFQILTKRPERAAQFVEWSRQRSVVEGVEVGNGPIGWARAHANVWIGTSVEDQAAADERIPHLLRTPAAVRFLSCEPLLGPVDLTRVYQDVMDEAHGVGALNAGVDWVIVGGESGPGARPCDVAWIRSIVEQCKAAGVPVFVKQLGAHPFEERPAQGGPQGTYEALAAFGQPHPQRKWFGADWCLTHTPDGRSRWIRSFRLNDRKGGDPSEWPDDLRVREFPAA